MRPPTPNLSLCTLLNLTSRSRHLTIIWSMPFIEAPMSSPLSSEVSSSFVVVIGVLLGSTRFTCVFPLPRPRPHLDVCCIPPALLRINLETGVTISAFRVSVLGPLPSTLLRPPSKFDFKSFFAAFLLDVFIFSFF